MQIAPAGDRALLVTLPGASSAHLRAVSENARKIAGVVAAIVGHESVYVIGTSDADALRAAVDTAHASEIVSPRRHRIEVSFHESHALDLDEFL